MIARCLKWVICGLVLLAMAGCASVFSPYQRADEMTCVADMPYEVQPSISGPSETSALVNETNPTPQQTSGKCKELKPTAYAGGAANAITAVNAQRTVYFDQMKAEGYVNSAYGLGLIALSADALYKGVTGSATSLLVSKESAAFGGLYAAGTWLNVKPTEAAYADGFQALTCTLLRSRALLMSTERFDSFSRRLGNLEEEISTVDRTLSLLQVKWDFGEENLRIKASKGENISSSDVIDQDNLVREIRRTVTALSQARKVYANGQALKAHVGNAGYSIREEANLVISKISSELSSNAPNISDLSSLSAVFSSSQKGLNTLVAIKLTPADTSATSSANRGEPVASNSKNPLALPVPGKNLDSKYFERMTLRRELAIEVSALYKIARDINAVIADMHDIYLESSHIAACTNLNGVPPLEISPSTLAEAVGPGDVLTFHTSGGTGIPDVSLTGVTGSNDSKTSPVVNTATGGVITSVVTIPKTASGKLELVAVDQSKPLQKVTVEIDVEGGAANAGATVTATSTDTAVKLSFKTPSESGGTLTGYTLKISNGAANGDNSLVFKKPDQGTSASAAKISGSISSVSNGQTGITITGLDAADTYTMTLSATFKDAADVEFTVKSGIRLTLPLPEFIVTPKDKLINLGFSVPTRNGDMLTGYLVTVTDSSKTAHALNLTKTTVQTTASATGFTATIVPAAKGKAAIAVSGLAAGEAYTIDLAADFQSGSKTNYTSKSNVKLNTPASGVDVKPGAGSGGAAGNAYSAVSDVDTIKLSFPIPESAGYDLLGYEVKVYEADKSGEASLIFSSAEAQATAAAADPNMKGVISSVSGGKVMISINGLTSNTMYSLGLQANFSNALSLPLYTWPAIKTLVDPVVQCGAPSGTATLSFKTPVALRGAVLKYELTVAKNGSPDADLKFSGDTQSTSDMSGSQIRGSISVLASGDTVITITGMDAKAAYSCKLVATIGKTSKAITGVKAADAQKK